VRALKKKYVTDQDGSRVAVMLDVTEYEEILAELEELDSIRAYDSAKAGHDEVVPFEQAVAEIEKDR
jgi:hypothetical protein